MVELCEKCLISGDFKQLSCPKDPYRIVDNTCNNEKLKQIMKRKLIVGKKFIITPYGSKYRIIVKKIEGRRIHLIQSYMHNDTRGTIFLAHRSVLIIKKN